MIVWNAIAIQELQELYDYIYGKSPQNAEKVANEIEDLILSIPFMPMKFPKEPACNNQNIRFVTKYSYKIIYEIDTIDIIILSIFSTSQGFIKITE